MTAPPAGTRSLLVRLKEWYVTASIIAFLTLALLILANLVVARVTRPETSSNPIDKYGLSTVCRAYPTWTSESVVALLTETYGDRNLDYHPFAQFTARPRKGRYITVLAPGFRAIKNQVPWPPTNASTNLFLFGGSTSFGLGVSDTETVASYLQEAVNSKKPERPLAVYNFGTPAYASRQEAMLFYDLLTSGTVPDTAVFVDGLNEIYWGATPALTTELRRYMQGKATLDLLLEVPMVRMAGILRRPTAPPSPPSADKIVEPVMKQWLDNKKAIEAMAHAFGVKVIFVWQPVPYYKYDWRHHLFCKSEADCTSPPTSVLYERMKQAYDAGSLGTDVLWLADLQAGRAEALYVDLVHYSPGFSRDIGAAIAGQVMTLADPRPGYYGSHPRDKRADDHHHS